MSYPSRTNSKLTNKAPTAPEWGDMVRGLRGDLNLSQEAMAKRCRVALRTLQRWEQGQHLPGENVRTFVLAMRRSRTAKSARASRICGNCGKRRDAHVQVMAGGRSDHCHRDPPAGKERTYFLEQ